MENENNKITTKEKNNNSEIKFSVAFKKDGDSFQNIMEKVLMSKINKVDL